MISWSNLPWQAWMYLATLPGMDAAQSLAHAKACPGCTDRVAAITRAAMGRAA
jgi:hypothetical protein